MREREILGIKEKVRERERERCSGLKIRCVCERERERYSGLKRR